MKKVLVWVACLLVAVLIAQLIPGCVQSKGYRTAAEIRSDAQITGVLTAITYGIAIFLARGLTKNMKKKSAEDVLKDQQAKQTFEETRHSGDQYFNR